MDKELLKGSIDILLLSLLAEKDYYGYEMTKQLRAYSNETFQMNEGTLYPALKRLEKKEWVTSYWSEETGGVKRKYYELTNSGAKQLSQKLIHWHQLHTLIERTMEGKHDPTTDIR